LILHRARDAEAEAVVAGLRVLVNPGAVPAELEMPPYDLGDVLIRVPATPGQDRMDGRVPLIVHNMLGKMQTP